MDLDSKRRQVAALRSKTVANGASPGEAENAARLADLLEERYGLGPDPAAVRPGRPDRPRPPRGSRVIVSVNQYQAMRRGMPLRKMQLREMHVFRIEAGMLIHSSEREGETRHPILSAERGCGTVTIRYS